MYIYICKCSYRYTKINTTNIFAVFESFMFDWPYTKFWMFSHIHLWENHWWLFLGTKLLKNLHVYTIFMNTGYRQWQSTLGGHHLEMRTRIECPPSYVLLLVTLRTCVITWKIYHFFFKFEWLYFGYSSMAAEWKELSTRGNIKLSVKNSEYTLKNL